EGGRRQGGCRRKRFFLPIQENRFELLGADLARRGGDALVDILLNPVADRRGFLLADEDTQVIDDRGPAEVHLVHDILDHGTVAKESKRRLVAYREFHGRLGLLRGGPARGEGLL